MDKSDTHSQQSSAPSTGTAPAGAAVLPSGVIAQDQEAAHPDSMSSDPNLLQIMRGSPPAADKMVRVSDGTSTQFPFTRWAFSHERELIPSVNVWRGTGVASRLPIAAQNLDSVEFTDMNKQSRTWGEMIALAYTDGIIVLHGGLVVYEKYFGALEAHRQHIAMSVTKSFTGTIAATLAFEGKLDLAAPVTAYVPELKQTAWADASVQKVMDMTVGVDYSEA